MKKCNAIILALFMIGLVACGADAIKAQKRQGATLIVTYDSGKVVTNSLFLAMSPDVKREIDRIETEAMMQATLGAVIADTRKNIERTKYLSDAQIALLYLAQMRKPADELAKVAPSNTVEFLIGAGMRQDVEKQNEVTK